MKSLYTKILVILLGSVFVASVAVGMAGIISAERVVQKDSVQILNLIGEEKRQEMNNQLGAIEQSVENLYLYADRQLSDSSELWQDRAYMTEYTSNLKNLLRTTAESTDSSLSVYIRFNQEFATSDIGVFLVRDKGYGEFVDMELTDIPQYNTDDTNHVGWYYEPIANGKPTWMAPYYNENIDVNMISYVIPIFREDTVIGVIGMDINLDLLKQCIAEVQVYDSGYAFLAAAGGDIIYHKDYPDGIGVKDFDENLIALGEFVGNERVEGRIYSYQWHGQNKKMNFFRLKNGMYLIITAPTAEIDAARNALIRRCLVILFIIIVCAAVPGIQIARQVTRPLRELTEAAEKVSAGEWDIDIQCDSGDEVAMLATTLSSTLKELNKYVSYVKSLAYTDELTGLNNKQAYNERVMELNSQIADGEAAFSLILLEINKLKYIADTYGRGTEEGAVISAAALMKQVFGEYDIYCISDDSFAVICQETDCVHLESLQRLFEEELQNFNKMRTACPEEIAVAVGFDCYQKEKDKRFSDVFVRADAKMYHDKQILNAKFGMREDALQMLRMVFHKILKVDLTQDTYYEIKTYDEEHTPEKGYSDKISEWMTQFAVTGHVLAEDCEGYLAFTDISGMKARMNSGATYLTYRYRRRVGEEIRWVQMEIVPSVEYTKENQIVMLYIRDIHDSYTAELDYRRELERLTNTDTLTGLFNRHYMAKYCEQYSNNPDTTIGVVFCDLNGLKYTNDNLGHAAGDALILKFADLLKESFPADMCCRMSGDEFVVCAFHCQKDEFEEMVKVLREKNGQDSRPLASIGYCWKEATSDIGTMLTEAENMMYVDKKHFYEAYPRYCR